MKKPQASSVFAFTRRFGGAFLAAAALSQDGHLGGGALAAGAGAALLTHVLKSGSRALINASPEPVSNWTASLGEDTVSVGALALVFSHPLLALGIVVGLVLLVFLGVAWLAKRLFGGIIRGSGTRTT